MTLSDHPALEFDAGVDPGHAWHLQVFIDNDKVFDRLVDAKATAPDAAAERNWQHISVDLTKYRNHPVVIRIYDLVRVPRPEHRTGRI